MFEVAENVFGNIWKCGIPAFFNESRDQPMFQQFEDRCVCKSGGPYLW